MWAGIVTVVIGVIGILLTGALARGSNVVRILFAIWIAFQIAGGTVRDDQPHGEQPRRGHRAASCSAS